MKKLFFLFAMFLCIGTLFAQPAAAEIAPESTFVDVLVSFFLPAITAAALVLFADAKKYFNTTEWSWSIFLYTKITPFTYTILGGIILYIILKFVPFTQPFLEILVGSPLSGLSAAGLFGAAAAIVDGFTKKK